MNPIILKCIHNDNEIFKYLTNRLRDNGLTITGDINRFEFRNETNSINGKVVFGMSVSNTFFNFEIKSPIGKFIGAVKHSPDKLILDIQKKPLLVARGMILSELKKIAGSDGFFQVEE